MLKYCGRCKKEKDIAYFSFNKTKSSGASDWCKECSNIYHAKYREMIRTDFDKLIKKREKANALYLRNKEKMCKFMLDKHCMDCGENNLVVLDFDHLHDKEQNISAMIGSRSWDSILNEISKCEVVCSNCHRKRTAFRMDTMKHRWQLAREESLIESR
jgi:hypothetical protein